MKEWLSGKLPRGRSDKPTTDQLNDTRQVNLVTLRAARVPCLETLDRALVFLYQSRDKGRSLVDPS